MTHIFIINPFAGDMTFADDLRTKLSSIKDLDYFVFNTRYAGYETELVKKIQHIFEGEKLRFYCCGGSGTMRNILNGFDDLSKAEVAFFPCGLTNDFLKVFGDAEERFHHIEELINGDVIKVDYIKTNYGVCLNTLSTGLDSNTVSKMEDFRTLRLINKSLPYTMGLLYAIFVAKNQKYEVTLDSGVVKRRFAEVFMGNGYAFGGNMFFEESTCVDDGKGIYCLVENLKGFKLLPVLTALTGKNHEKRKKLTVNGECRKIRMKLASGRSFSINQDGDLIRDVEVCEAEIIHKGLSFVVPKGVIL